MPKIYSKRNKFGSNFEIETYFLKEIGDFMTLGPKFSFLFWHSTLNEDLTGFPATYTFDEDLLTPLQLLINDWLKSISWLSAYELYKLQVAICFFDDVDFNGTNSYFGYIQRYFVAFGYRRTFANRFNQEFDSMSWRYTITRWQIVSMCVGAGFPDWAIRGSLQYFFSLGWTEITLSYVYENILVGDWFLEIDGIVDFNPSWNPTFDWSTLPGAYWGAWVTWNSCSVPCGTGVRTRERPCERIQESQNCQNYPSAQVDQGICSFGICKTGSGVVNSAASNIRLTLGLDDNLFLSRIPQESFSFAWQSQGFDRFMVLVTLIETLSSSHLTLVAYQKQLAMDYGH